MKRTNLLLAVFFAAVCALSAQTKPKLAVLPFTGGRDQDGETISMLLSGQPDISAAFTVMPRNSATTDFIRREQRFQESGLTDSDTLSLLGKRLGADFVVAGHIKSLGNRNLVLFNIINVETFQQIAGDYKDYGEISEMRGKLPDVAKRLIAATRLNTRIMPRLAILPFGMKEGVDQGVADVLATILATEIANSGKYAVLPRTTTINQVLKEHEIQGSVSGQIDPATMKELGKALNAQYVLSGNVMPLGKMNLFIAQILDVELGSLLPGAHADEEYLGIDDGYLLMPKVAKKLTSVSIVGNPPPPPLTDAPPPVTPPDFVRPLPPIPDPSPANQPAAAAAAPAKFWSVGVSAGSAFSAPGIIGTVRGTLAPLRYSFLELGLDLGMLSSHENSGYYSLYPYAHYCLFVPFAKKGGWYIGAGAGYMISSYTFPEEPDEYQYLSGESAQFSIFAGDIVTGFSIADIVDISYTLRTNFKSASNKVSVGYTYRF